MHGIMLWKPKHKDYVSTGNSPEASLPSCPDCTLSDKLKDYQTSSLYTWQDQRCSPSFLASLPPQSETNQSLATGYGCATLFWLLQHQRQMLKQAAYHCCGTIMDFLTCLLCDLDFPVTSDQLAASLGYFNSSKKQWDSVLANTPGFPHHILPTVMEAGKCIGKVTASLKAWPVGAPVLAALGDVQCAMFSLMRSPSTAILNIGTSIQLGFLTQTSHIPALRQESPPAISFFPFFHSYSLALCAGLNGGNAVHHFASCLSSWMADLQGSNEKLDPEYLISKLQCLAEEDDKSSYVDAEERERREGKSQQFLFCPSFFGERHDTQLTGSISGISLTNFQSVGHMFRRLCEGIIHHLGSMVSSEYLLTRGVDRLSVCGSVPAKNCFVRQAIQLVYGCGKESLQIDWALDGKELMNSAKGAARVVGQGLSMT